MSDMQAM